MLLLKIVTVLLGALQYSALSAALPAPADDIIISIFREAFQGINLRVGGPPFQPYLRSLALGEFKIDVPIEISHTSWNRVDGFATVPPGVGKHSDCEVGDGSYRISGMTPFALVYRFAVSPALPAYNPESSDK
ncbi:hypothetical protein BKA70DRAFT_1230763 [Coprinopsis sp. MPI-PUGE-AT-0042]|nr:hypothetical protein BKA70DRAFT_1230763 [Coprinopsis sp. MPI-PUGE-AT-0042]